MPAGDQAVPASNPASTADTLPRRGLMLILSSPSGAGKTTLTRMLLQTKTLDLTLSISVTTRPRRSSEVDGIHYSFITKKQFDVTIFILPPSMQELKARLERRAEDSRETIDKRLANAKNEITRWELYDYVLINDDLQKTFDELLAILRAERDKVARRKEGVSTFVAQLLRED
jgi:guanylate kinase